MDTLKYPIFFIIAFGIIGYYAVQAWGLWHERIAHEIEVVVVR